MNNESILLNSSFELTINNCKSNCIIKKRKKANDKPPLYIYDTTRICYISSLIPTNKEDTYNFHVRLKNDDVQFYQLKIIDSQIHICESSREEFAKKR